MIYVVKAHELPEVTIFASRESLGKFAEWLRNTENTRFVFDRIPAARLDLGLQLDCAVKNVTATLLSFEIANTALHFVGSSANIAWLAEELFETSEIEGFGHLHFEHYDGHPVIGASSVAIVVCEI